MCASDSFQHAGYTSDSYRSYSYTRVTVTEVTGTYLVTAVEYVVSYIFSLFQVLHYNVLVSK
jgi:hypothetical protein